MPHLEVSQNISEPNVPSGLRSRRGRLASAHGPGFVVALAPALCSEDMDMSPCSAGDT